MYIRKMIMVIVLMFCLTGSAQILDLPSDTTANDSTPVYSFSHYHYGLSMTPRMSLEAKIHLWIWENEDRFGPALTLSYRPLVNDKLLPSFGLDGNTSDPFSIPEYDFQQSDGQVMDRFVFEGMSEDARTNRPVMLPISSLITTIGKFLSRFGGEESGLPTSISLTDDQIKMLSILWEQPDLSIERWYLEYVEAGYGKRVPFRRFESFAEKMEREGFIRYRISSQNWLQSIKGPIHKYTANFNRKSILYALRRESINADALSSGRRHFELIRMKSLLRDRDIFR